MRDSHGSAGVGGGVLAPVRLDSRGTDPLLRRAFPPLATEVEWGLHRVEALLSATGNPHLACPSILIGGTNGKGSAASNVASVLSRSGLRTGLYTSPHLCSFRERFQIDGVLVDEAGLIETADELRSGFSAFGLTFFEAATALAFHLFKKHEVEVIAVEVGLGGRLDATNVLAPLVSAITNVAMDHSEYLGNSLHAIAGEKAGIIKPRTPFVTAELDPEVLELLRDRCAELEAPCHVIPRLTLEGGPEVGEDHTSFSIDTEEWGTLRVWTPLVGSHQAANAALAVGILERLPEELRPDRQAVLSGVHDVCWPGRVQVEHREGQTWVFDVAHNAAGVAALSATLNRLNLPRPLVVLAGILGDKDWGAMLPPLLDLADHAVLTQAPSAPPARRWDPYSVCRTIETACPVEIDEEFPRALSRGRALASSGTLVVTGSNHTVGDALGLLDLAPFE